MALANTMPATAWDQFMIPFDLQKDDGRLPDLVGRATTSWNSVKPPIHGWTFQYMLAHGKFTDAQVGEAYTGLSREIRFWFEQRDSNKNGIPEYGHGNDSGWDNGTEFDIDGQPKKYTWRESANLCAFLVLQMDELHDLALKLGKQDEALDWQKKSDEMLKKMLANLWTGDRFITKRVDNGEWNQKSESLMAYLPIVLGKKLPADILQKLIHGLKNDGYVTQWGLATESVQGPLFKPDGYWRGPVWGPTTLLIVDGLRRSGEEAFAKKIAKGYCDACAKSGFSENFNALTGEGCGDPAYTWTASAFLILAHD
jgi:glycogen debranching enzyme